MDNELLTLLICPICKAKLKYQPEQRRLLCQVEQIAFPITEEGIPLLLAEEAVALGEITGE